MNDRRFSVQRIGYYKVTRKDVGSGHFAKVVEALHRPTQVKCAIKIIDLEKVRASSYLSKNLTRESEILSKLHHPGIVQLFEVAETKNHHYICMELAGECLCEFIFRQKYGKCDEPMARMLARQIVSAVSYLHSNEVIHRDIKMDNILVNPDTNRLKLIDFGLSSFYDPAKFLKTNCGSPEYAAPELYLSTKYDSKVDIWSVGVVFYGMMIGQLPFAMRNPKNTSTSERKEYFKVEVQKGLKRQKHQSLLNGTPIPFRHLLYKLMEPNPQDRYDIHMLENHPWIYEEFTEKFQEISGDWKYDAVQETADAMGVSFAQVMSNIEEDPYGPVGGIYNIKKYLYLENRTKFELRNESPVYNQFSKRPQTSVDSKKTKSKISEFQSRPQTENSEIKQRKLFPRLSKIKKIILKLPY